MPFDNLKTRLQSKNTGYRSSMVNCAMRMIHEEGVRSFWRGTTPRLVRLMVSAVLSGALNFVFLTMYSSLALLRSQSTTKQCC